MKIRSHRESHIVELADRSRWKIFPADLDITLNWEPETDFRIEASEDDLSSHELVDESNGQRVRVISADQDWPLPEVKEALKDE